MRGTCERRAQRHEQCRTFASSDTRKFFGVLFQFRHSSAEHLDGMREELCARALNRNPRFFVHHGSRTENYVSPLLCVGRKCHVVTNGGEEMSDLLVLQLVRQLHTDPCTKFRSRKMSNRFFLP